MNNYSIIDQHTSDLPDYDLVGCGEIGIPLYNCKISFLYSEKKSLPILLEFILNLFREQIGEKDMAQLLAIDEDVISDGIASLYQTDYINPLSKELTPKGYEYLEKNQIDSFEKGEMDILIDALTGDFDINVNRHMSQSVAKSNNLSCIRCYIQQPTIDNIDYNNLKKAFNQFKAKNEWATAGDIIEVISLEKQNMRYKRICILIFQNKGGDVRIQAYDRSRKNEKYEQILKNMDENDNIKLLRDNVGEFFESGECTKIYSALEPVFNVERICNFKSYMEFFENEINCTIIIPLIEPINITDLFYYQLENKLKKKETITLIISGNEFLSSTQENLVYKLLLLCDTYDNLIMKQFPILVPSMIYTNNKGKISRLEQTNINLKTTQNGLVERFYDLTDHDLNKVFSIIPEIKGNELISFDFTEMNRDEIKEKMELLKRLLYDCDSLITSTLGAGLINGNSLQGENEFLNIPLSTNKDKYKLFADAFNKTIFESIKQNGKSIGKKDFFWNEFKLAYPELQRVIDKIRVYRNKDSHHKLDKANAKLYEEYLLEDLNGYMPDFIKKGFLYLQHKLLVELEAALRNIIKMQYEHGK